MDPFLPLTGFVFGSIVGLTSMGGGSLLAPFLILVVGVQPAMAVATDLAYGSVTKIVGAGIYWRQGLVDLAVVRRLAAGSIPGGLLGVMTFWQMRAHAIDVDKVVRSAIGFVLALVALVLIWRLVKPLRPIATSRLSPGTSRAVTVAFGLIVGFLVGLTSVGSGSLVAPFLLLLYPLTAAEIVATDLFHAAILVTVSAIPAVLMGAVDWPLVAGLLVGSIPGVALGSCLAPRVSPFALRAALAALLIASAIKLI